MCCVIIVLGRWRLEPSPQGSSRSGAGRAVRGAPADRHATAWSSATASNEPGGGAADGGARPQATRRHRCDTAAVAIEGTSSCVHCEAPDALRNAETSLAAIVAACMMVAGLCVTGARNALAVARTTTTLSNDILTVLQYNYDGRRGNALQIGYAGHAGSHGVQPPPCAVLRRLRTCVTPLSPRREMERESH